LKSLSLLVIIVNDIASEGKFILLELGKVLTERENILTEGKK